MNNPNLIYPLDNYFWLCELFEIVPTYERFKRFFNSRDNRYGGEMAPEDLWLDQLIKYKQKHTKSCSIL